LLEDFLEDLQKTDKRFCNQEAEEAESTQSEALEESQKKSIG
jgi:hypothetical protein